VAAVITVAAIRLDVYALPAALAAAAVCFVIRMLGVLFGLNAPGPPGIGENSSPTDSDPPAAGGGDER
jgi:hypothetical protein